MFASFERYLKKKNGFNIIMDKGFERAREALQSKQTELKQNEKGNKPNELLLLVKMKSNCFTINNFGNFESRSLNAVWFNNTFHKRLN